MVNEVQWVVRLSRREVNTNAVGFHSFALLHLVLERKISTGTPLAGAQRVERIEFGAGVVVRFRVRTMYSRSPRNRFDPVPTHLRLGLGLGLGLGLFQAAVARLGIHRLGWIE